MTGEFGRDFDRNSENGIRRIGPGVGGRSGTDRFTASVSSATGFKIHPWTKMFPDMGLEAIF